MTDAEQVAPVIAKLVADTLAADPEIRREAIKEAARGVRQLTTNQVAEMLGCHRKTVERSDALQKLAFFDDDLGGKRWRIDDLTAYQERKRDKKNEIQWSDE